MRILVAGNCTSFGIATCLKVMTNAEVVSREAFDSDRLADVAGEFDLVFATPFNDRPLEDRLPFLRGRVFYYPRITYQAYHPDVVYAFNEGKRITSPMGEYNSSIVLYAWRAGLDVEEIVSLFQPNIFEMLGFLGPDYETTEHIRWVETDNSIDTRDLVERWKASGCFMHTVNHPKLRVVADLARALTAKAGITTTTSTAESFVQDNLLDSAVWPIYPEIAAVRGGHGSYDFKTIAFREQHVPVVLGLDDFIAGSLAAYDGLNPEEIACERLDTAAYLSLGELISSSRPKPAPVFSVRKKSPYHGLPDEQFWKPAVAMPAPSEVDPVVRGAFKVTETTKVATAGSCFAQHLSNALSRTGFNYYVTETGSRERGFGVYSARYGNVYTARQLDQLFDRAYGTFTPHDVSWRDPEGYYIDPFRPGIERVGFRNEKALLRDREKHFGHVRHLFQTLDVLVFTLGLTEAWQSKVDGAVFPSAPGVAAGRMDDKLYEFVNFTANDVEADLRRFIEKLREVNPGSRMLLTVSPVPLKATYESAHVLKATTYSKAALRVAADMVSRDVPDVHYFPSFEIITGSYSRGAYWDDDLRTVKREGVDHVMRLFLKHFAQTDERPNREIEALQEIMCDEDKIEQRAANG